ncbi:MAG: aldose 1-epimerase family protein [Anaerolineae bacterium]
MPKLFGRDYKKEELLRKVGSVSQLGGVRLAELADGRAKGVTVADFNLGNGFEFTVVPDRAMDIFAARFQGMSLAWHSSGGMAAPSYYEPQGLGWLRTFAGGLLVTCGLTYVGAPAVDEGQELGLHGRVSALPASSVHVGGCWDGDDYIMSASGEVRESVLFGANLCLYRKVWARLGERRLFIEDLVRNEGFRRTPHQILYHINCGFPLVDVGSRLLSSSASVSPRDAEARKDSQDFNLFTAPVPGFAEKVYYHDMTPDADGYVWAALMNWTLWQGQPFGFYVKYRKEQLPRFIEWKMMGEGDYVVGMEPANCGVEGRNVDRANGTLVCLEPGEERQYQLELGLIVGESEYQEFRKRMP